MRYKLLAAAALAAVAMAGHASAQELPSCEKPLGTIAVWEKTIMSGVMSGRVDDAAAVLVRLSQDTNCFVVAEAVNRKDAQTRGLERAAATGGMPMVAQPVKTPGVDYLFQVGDYTDGGGEGNEITRQMRRNWNADMSRVIGLSRRTDKATATITVTDWRDATVGSRHQFTGHGDTKHRRWAKATPFIDTGNHIVVVDAITDAFVQTVNALKSKAQQSAALQ